MIKKTIISVLLILAIISSFLVVFAQDSKVIEQDKNDNTVVIKVVIDEDQFCGAEFSFSIQDIDELKPLEDEEGDCIAFELNNKLNASSIGFIEKNGKYYFGFYSSDNKFDGETYVGDLKFEYTGNKENKIIFDDMLIARMNENNKPEGEQVEYPVSEYIIKRASGSKDPKPGGGSGGGGSNKDQVKEEEETPPITYTVMKPTRPAGSEVSAIKTNNSLILEGEETEFPAVNIDNYNWLKLRDIAMILNGTSKQFSIAYNEETKIIDITTGGSYTPVGDELKDMLTEPITAIATPQKIRFNGEVIDIIAYNVEGYNYFRLRDLAILLDIAVDYNDITRVITLDLDNPYKE